MFVAGASGFGGSGEKGVVFLSGYLRAGEFEGNFVKVSWDGGGQLTSWRARKARLQLPERDL